MPKTEKYFQKPIDKPKIWVYNKHINQQNGKNSSRLWNKTVLNNETATIKSVYIKVF